MLWFEGCWYLMWLVWRAFSGSGPITILRSGEFLKHRVSDRGLRSFSEVYIKYSREGKSIPREDTRRNVFSGLGIKESSGTSRNSPSDAHLILTFHLHSKSLPIKCAEVSRQKKIFFFSRCPRITFKKWEIKKNLCVTFVRRRGLAKSEGVRV